MIKHFCYILFIQTKKNELEQHKGLCLPVQGYPTRAGYISPHGTVVHWHIQSKTFVNNH